MAEFCKSHDIFVQHAAKRIGFTIKQHLKQNPEIILIISHTLQAYILHEIALDMFIDWKRIHLVLASGDLQSATEENSCLSWLAKVLLYSPRVQPRTIIAPYVDLHSYIKVNEFYNCADLGHDTLGYYVPIDKAMNDLDDENDSEMDEQQEFRNNISYVKAKLQMLQKSQKGYKPLNDESYKVLYQSYYDNLTTFINDQTYKKSLLGRAQIKIQPTISQFKTQYDQAVAAASRKIEKLMSLGFPVILAGAADIDSFCGCIAEDGVLICKDSYFRAGQKILDGATEIISTFDENELYEFYQENRQKYFEYTKNNYCFVGLVE